RLITLQAYLRGQGTDLIQTNDVPSDIAKGQNGNRVMKSVNSWAGSCQKTIRAPSSLKSLASASSSCLVSIVDIPLPDAYHQIWRSSSILMAYTLCSLPDAPHLHSQWSACPCNCQSAVAVSLSQATAVPPPVGHPW